MIHKASDPSTTVDVERNIVDNVNMSKTGWRRWGAELRRHRLNAGLNQRKLAREARLSAATISSFETASRTPRQWHAEVLDSLTGAGGELIRLYHDVEGESGIPEKWRKFDEIERDATEIREYHSGIVPGLIQHEDYAKSVLLNTAMSQDDDIEPLVDKRIKRFESVKNARLNFVLNEHAIRHVVGSRDVQVQQIEHLYNLAKSRRIVLGVIPDETPHHPCPTGSFRLLSLADGRIICHEEHYSGSYVSTSAECQWLLSVFGTLQAESLPWGQTLDLLEKVGKELKDG